MSRLNIIQRALGHSYLGVSEDDRLADERWMVDEIKRLRALSAAEEIEKQRQKVGS